MSNVKGIDRSENTFLVISSKWIFTERSTWWHLALGTDDLSFGIQGQRSRFLKGQTCFGAYLQRELTERGVTNPRVNCIARSSCDLHTKFTPRNTKTNLHLVESWKVSSKKKLYWLWKVSIYAGERILYGIQLDYFLVFILVNIRKKCISSATNVSSQIQ